MSGIAAVIDWGTRPIPPTHMDRMLASIPHRSTDGTAVVAGGSVAMGFARRATTERQAKDTQPFEDTRTGLRIVADVRLDNPGELARALEPSSAGELPDAELLLLAYWHWGESLSEHLEGDFALVIWDPMRQQAYAARDPFGVRPLFFHATASRLAFATEVEQLLAILEDAPALEDRLVLDFLRGDYRHNQQTFYRGISRVLPGHYLVATSAGHRHVRYWRPPTRPLALEPEDCRIKFRRLLRNAVTARLDSDRPLLAHLSGGLDSSSIVCLADEIYASDREVRGRQPLTLASAIFPGLECDESELIDAVVVRVRFDSARWDGTAPTAPSGGCGLIRGHPWSDLEAAAFSGDYWLASRAGARVVLSGLGGDELLFERGVFRDLAARGRWIRLAHECSLAPNYSTRSRAFFLGDALRTVVPALLRHAYRRLWPHHASPPPCWLGPQLRALWDDPCSMVDPTVGPWRSHTQRSTWDWLTGPNLGIRLEQQELEAAHHGVEFRYPFLDHQLARFVLSLPYERRLPGGRMKRILRDAMADRLPPCIARRKGVTTFEPVLRESLRRNLATLHCLFATDRTWASAPYVDRSAARGLFERLDLASPGHAACGGWAIVWNIAVLELWLRALG